MGEQGSTSMTGAGAANYRGMLAIVIILGALIMMGIGALLAGFYLKAGQPAQTASVPKAPFFNDLHVSNRSEIVDASISGDRLLVRLRNDYGQQLVVLDARDGREIGRVGVGLQYNDSP